MDDGTGDGRGVDDESDPTTAEDGDPDLDNVSDGAGCAEIWERLSERRRQGGDDGGDAG